MSKPVVALFSPADNVVSETFIRAHRDNINADIRFYTNGRIPTWVNERPIMRFKYQLQFFLLKRQGKLNGFSIDEFALKKSLQEHKPDLVLCEYGFTATQSLRVISSLGLPMMVYFHGQDLSATDVLRENNNYKDVLAYASKLFVVSREQEERLLSFGARPEKLIYNPCAPNDTYFTAERTSKPKQLFLAAGRFVNKKAPYLTLLAFKQVLQKYPKARLVLAGNGELHQAVRDLAAYHGIDKNVELPGTFNGDQIRDWLRNAVAFVQHSVTAENGDQEGTPVVILEAMAAGVPVVSTKHAGIKDIIADGKTGYLVDEYDIEAMAQKMIAVLDDPANAVVVGEAGREFVRQNLTMKQHIGKIDQAIADVLA